MTDASKLTVEERQVLRAKHTCIKNCSSMACHACNTGVPYPALTIEEINDALGIGNRERIAAEAALLARPRRRR